MHGERFYTCHLEQVESVLIRFDYCSFPMRAAAWLHDTVEKSNVKLSDIDREFSGYIASTVDAVTSVAGNILKQGNSATYRRIKERGGNAIVLKLADCIANVEETIRTGDRLSTFEEEYSEFRDALYESGNADAMWAHLDTLIEVRTETLNRRNLAAFANNVSLSKKPSTRDVKSVGHPSRD